MPLLNSDEYSNRNSDQESSALMSIAARKGKKKLSSSKSVEDSEVTLDCKHRPRAGSFMGKARAVCKLPFISGAAPKKSEPTADDEDSSDDGDDDDWGPCPNHHSCIESNQELPPVLEDPIGLELVGRVLRMVTWGCSAIDKDRRKSGVNHARSNPSNYYCHSRKSNMAGDNTKKENPKGDGGASDHNSPYYLHPSDYPRQMHVNDALTDNNYLDWVQEMENFLFAKNKIGFIDGTIEKPEKTDANHMAWMRCDVMIKGWLTTAMEKEIRGSVKYANSAAEIWSDLRERFGKESAPRAYELKQSISNTRQDGITVSAYYTKLRGLWDEIQSFLPTLKCTCNGCVCGLGKSLRELREKEQLYEFLMGLDNDFSIIRTQILAMKPIPSLGNAYHLVAEDEQQRSITGGKRTANETIAFQATVKRYTPPTKPGQKDEKPTGHCDFCGRDGHTRDGCFKRIGYPEWWPGKNKREKGKPKAIITHFD
ncbi:hypothetical protein E3N88_31753 [Mikania micrantha]|uniref:Retrotransposon Copia-like N-terminal domain-containing protein n=1 Tax=Mikania micrantha TaxID=192012 RepID=A0A5N6M6J5_9ASTR|nr:hypothetical protein E3N88_31753 [Mikania micrantha]